MSAPLVVNVVGGAVWTRREATRDGLALYAPEKCGTCPESVMATYAELEVRGIAGAADVLPVPVGPEPQADPVAVGRRLDLLALMDQRAASVVSPVLAAVLDEAERLRVERDEFCDRVDTLTAVAQGNKRHVVSLTTECQRLTARVAELEAERHSTNEAPDAMTRTYMPVASLREPEGEFYGFLHREGPVPHDLPETGGA